ncbi:hypothetical protein [Metabacillus fastidiosus]|uniref:hypothetical protein n=1 Tax=Metabacillus fastidiosus TaxID=1458 RepID=UPI002DB84EF3|nr:hypothetical protein [Metabacillus fastidiosus]MEC2076096.1 hypothetical protein [Metabacillus fastidiosus]
MSKKKIAKFGLTAAVAATTVVAATPADAAAASTTEKAVQQAAQSANALVKYYGSTDLKVSSEFTTAFNSAKKAVANAKAALAKYNGADKSKHEATVASAEEKLTNATRYIDAVNILSGELKTATNAVAAEIKAGKVDDDTVINYNKLSAAIKKAEGVIGKVRGDQVRKAFGKSFLLDAKLTREAVIYEVSQYQLLKQIDASIKAGQLDKADADFAKLERLKKRAVEIKEDGRKLYPGRNDVYPDLPEIEKQLRDTEKAHRDARGIEAVDFVKAVNATTVEITFKNEVKGTIQASDYRIEGLEVKNAAVKQSDNKTIVLTTSAQKGGEKYTVKYNSKIAGTFDGISSVVPAKISLVETALQGVVGKEITLKADIGVKEAGVPVTFNIKSENKLDQDYVVEALTDANGIATYSYTQYIAGNTNDVAVYPTGAPATRDIAKVFWGADTILTVVADDKKGNTLNNGENKVYKVTLKDAKTGKVVEGRKLNVTFKENVDVTVDKLTKATVNGVNPYQLSNGDKKDVQVTTNSKGEATFTVTGTNTKATPVVFEDNDKVNQKLDSAELQVSAEQVTFAAQQVSHEITVTRDGGEEAAVGTDNGRKYKVVVKDKDGKVAAGEIVNVAINEDIDRNISTNSKATFEQLADKDLAGDRTYTAGSANKQITLKLNSKGEGEFVIATGTGNINDYATPVVWLDINSSDAKEGKLDEGEAFKLADKTYFVASKLTSGSLKAYDVAGNRVKEDQTFKGTDTATFEFAATNQSGKTVPTASQPKINASYTVFNTGTSDVEVYDADKAKWETVSPNRSLTLTVISNAASKNTLSVRPAGDKTASVRVEANATTVPAVGSTDSAISLGNQEAKASFVSTTDIGTSYIGTVTAIDTKDGKIAFDGKDSISYKTATFRYNNADVEKAVFERTVQSYDNVKVHYNKDKDGKETFTILSFGVSKYTSGTITLDKALYNGTDTNATITVKDTDLDITTGASNDTATVTFTDANGAAVSVTLSETGTAGTFSATPALGTLPEGTFTVAYTDTHNADGATGTVKATAKLDRTAPTGTLPAVTNATTNDVDSLVVTFNEELYINGTAVANGADVKTAFTAAGGTLAITTAIYDATAKTVTFTLANAADTNTITHNSNTTALTDAAGNKYAAKVYTYNAAGTIWASN